MSEIKFRFWDRKAEKMVDWMTLMQTAFNRGDNPLLYSVFSRDKMDGDLLQYTGLKDKDGKEVYEGDIVKYQEGEEKGIAEIKHFGKTCNLHFVWIKQETPKPSLAEGVEYYGYSGALEVIGNIYENPELAV